MPREVHRYDAPDRFVAGTVGQPGERTFFLQATAGGRTTTVALEKVQVAALAGRLEEMLDELRRRGDEKVPEGAPPELDDVAPLDAPVTEEFRVGTLALAWDGDDGRVVVEAYAQTADDVAAPTLEENPDEGPAVLHVRITAAQGRAFAARAARVVGAGRPPCPLCGLPLDPVGHVCPRQNGHRH